MMYNISQNKELWEEMDKTGERHFVECAPRDRRSEDEVSKKNLNMSVELFKDGALVSVSTIPDVMTRASGEVRTGWASVWMK